MAYIILLPPSHRMNHVDNLSSCKYLIDRNCSEDIKLSALN